MVIVTLITSVRTMKFDVNIKLHSLILIFTVLALARYSVQDKPEDCIVGVQYYSHRSILDGEGTCAKCPLHLRNCHGQPMGDQTSCLRSCAAKPKPSEKKLTTTKWPPTSTSYVTSPPPKVISFLYTSGQSNPHRNEENEEEEKPTGVNGDYAGVNKIALIISLVVLGVTSLALIVLIVVLLIRKNSRSQSTDPNDPENREAIPLVGVNQTAPQSSGEQLQQATTQAAEEQPDHQDSEEQPNASEEQPSHHASEGQLNASEEQPSHHASERQPNNQSSEGQPSHQESERQPPHHASEELTSHQTSDKHPTQDSLFVGVSGDHHRNLHTEESCSNHTQYDSALHLQEYYD